MDAVETKLREKYQKKWKFPTYTDDELKDIAKGIYNGEIYTDRHCPHEIMSVFMILVFMGPHGLSNDQRDSKLYDILEKDIEKEYYDKFINQVGLVFEYVKEAGPMAVNGHPTFFSARFLSKDDTQKMFDFYEKYKEIREKADNF